MADGRCWNREIVIKFIKLYRDMPCLWKVKSKDYLNRHLKNESYDKLVDFCKPIFPEANRDFVYKKIQSLRGAFRKEYKRVTDSKRSGKEVEEVYTPTLWYYDLLLFTVEKENSILNVDMEEGEVEDDPFLEEDTRVKIEATEFVDMDDASTESRTLASDKPTKRPAAAIPNDNTKKTKWDSEVESFIQTCTETLQHLEHRRTDISEFEATGIKIAKQLERMEPLQAIYADSLISAVIKRGLLRTLQPQTTLCDNEHNASDCCESLNSTNYQQ